MHKHKPHIYPTYPGTCGGRTSDGKPCARNLGRGDGSGTHLLVVSAENGHGLCESRSAFCLDHCPICAEERLRKEMAR